MSVENTRPHNCGVSPSCIATAPPQSRAPWDFYFSLLETKQPLPFCQSPNRIKRRVLHKSLTHGYLFETRKQTISMEMQCLHAWQKSIICHFENVKSVSWGFSFILLAAFSSLLACFFFLCSSRRKNKWCKCPRAWLNTSSFFLVRACVAGEISQ